LERLTQWLKQPFSTDQNATSWFLFTGMIIVMLALWAVIIKDLRSEL
jgi:hypothetical protein